MPAMALCRPRASTKSGRVSREHFTVIAEHGRVAYLRGPRRGQRDVGILHADELYVRHARERLQIRRVVKRVPVADADGCDPDAIKGGDPGQGARAQAVLHRVDPPALVATSTRATGRARSA